MLIKVSGKIQSGKDTVGKMIQVLLANKDLKPEITIEDDFRTREQYSGFEIKKFAGPLKEIISVMTGISLKDLERADVKDTILPIEWQVYEIYNFDKKTPKSFDTLQEAINYCDEYDNSQHRYRYKVTARTVRWLLQYVGTELFRDQIHENIHVNMVLSTYKVGVSNWIFTDTRFFNELACRASDGAGLSIRVNRPLQERHPELFASYAARVEKYKDLDFWNWLQEENEDAYAKLTHASETELDDASFNYIINNNGDIHDLAEQVNQILIKERLL